MKKQEKMSVGKTSPLSKDMSLVMKDLGETVQNFHTNALSVLSLSEQWKSLQSSLAMAEALLSSRRKEFELKEKRNEEISRKVESLLSDVELMKVELGVREKLVNERCKDVDFREKGLRGVGGFEAVSKEKEIRERERVLELRERELSESCKRLVLKEKEVNEGFRACCKELEVKQEVLIESRKAVGVKERELEEGCKELELRRARIDEERKGLEVKKKEMEEGFKMLKLKEKEINEGFRVLESREKEMSEGFRVLESKQKEMSEGFRVLELKEKEISEGFVVLESKQKDMNEVFRVLESKEKEMNEGFRVLELEKKEMNEGFQVLESKEKDVDERLQVVELKERKLKKGRRGLKSKEKEIDKRFRVLERKEKEMSVALRKLGLKEKEFGDCCRAVEMKEKEEELKEGQINKQWKSLKSKEKMLSDSQVVLELGEKQMNESVDALESKLKQVEDCCKGIELKHRQAVELRERQSNEGFEALETKMQQIAECCKKMELKEKEIEERMQAIQVKEKQLTRRGRVLALREQQIKEKGISEQCQTSKFREVDESCHSLELKEKQLGEVLAEKAINAMQSNDVCHVLMEEQISKTCTTVDSSQKETVDLKVDQLRGEPQSETSQVTHAVASRPRTEIQFLCENMDAKGVRSYLIEHVKECDTWHENMLDSLQLASDPPKLVLEVTRGFCQLGVDNIPGDDCKAACVYLLVQLMELQPDIRPCVQNDAKVFGATWRNSLAKQRETAPELFCFLQFLASYKLASSFDADELLSLFETFYSETEVNWPDHNPKLCQALYLTKMIPDLIHSLIWGNKQLQAVLYICAFQMEEAIPPKYLLEAHLKYIQRTAEDIVKQGSSQDDAASIEIKALRAILKCISNFKLESSYSPAPLEVRIKQLEKEMKDRKSTANLLTVKKCDPNLEDGQVLDSVVAETTPDLLSDAHSIPHDQKKHSATSVVSLDQKKRPRQWQTDDVSTKQNKHTRVLAPQRQIPHTPSSLLGQPAFHWPYGYNALPFPATNWASNHFGASGAVYGVPYDMRTGRIGVAGLYPSIPQTPITHARGQVQRTAHSRGRSTVNANASRS